MYDIKTGDDTPALRFAIKDADGTVPDLTGSTVTLKLVRKSDGVVVTLSGTMTVVSPASTSGQVQYAFPLNGYPTPGEHLGEISVLYASGRHTTYPGKGTISININAKL